MTNQKVRAALVMAEEIQPNCNCRENGSKSTCWALALSENRPIVRKTRDFVLHELVMTGKVGRGRLRRVSPQLNEGESEGVFSYPE